ncbi:MAG: PAS domain S-box protein [Gammaproteobacteria bacterium]|nr:PAS domain S-box protein [Gammaproteobacteria bacterium]
MPPSTPHFSEWGIAVSALLMCPNVATAGVFSEHTGTSLLAGAALLLVGLAVAWRYFSLVSVNRQLTNSLAQCKKAEHNLRDSERQLQGLMYHANAIIYIKDLDGRYLLTNRRFDEIAHLGQASALGKTDYDVFPGKMADMFRESDQLVLESHRVQEFEQVVPGEHNDNVYLVVKYCLYDEHGEPYALAGMATDISKRVFAERRMRQSEQRYRQLVETLSDEYFFYSQDQDGNYNYVSPSITAILGRNEDEFAEHWTSYLTGNPLNAGVTDMPRKALRGMHVPSYEMEMFHADGRRRRLEVFASPLKDDADAILGLEGIVHDVTKRTEVEEKLQRQEYELRQILDNMLDGVIAIDDTGIVRRFNRSAARMFGYSSDEMVGQSINVLMPVPDSENHDQHLQYYLKTGNANAIGRDRVVMARRRNGEIFPMRLSVAELPKQDDGARRFIGSCSDVTAQRQQEEQLRRSAKMDALGKLTGGIAHDYNNMLGVILGYSEILATSLSDPRLTKYVSEIHRAGERGAKLTRRLLSFSRRQMSAAEAVDINVLLDDIHLMLEKSLTARISLCYELEDDLWLVWLDRGDLEDAILNMSINAMHAIPKEGSLTITTRNRHLSEHDAALLGLGHSAGDFVHLSLSDTGKGMDEETRSKIFDPFFSTKGENGTGLGLSQVYGFAQQASGSIDVRSRPNQGTCFNLYFPRHHLRGKKGGEPKREPTPLRATGTGTVLVVDDDRALRELTVDTLMRYGYQVYNADNAEGALELLHQQPVDLVLSDVVMPGMDGYQLAETIQQQYPSIKIQLVSGYTGDQQPAHVDEKLQARLISKPFSSEHLFRRISSLLNETSQKGSE